MWPIVVSRVRPMISPRAYGIPVRCAEPTKAGTSTRRPSRARSPASRSTSGDAGDGFQAVAHPLHGGAGDEYGAFEAVGGLARRPSSPPSSAAHASSDTAVGPRIEQQEAAGAVGVLGRTRLEAGLSEERRLLIAGHSGDGDPSAEQATRRSRRRPRSTPGLPDSIARGTSSARSSSSSHDERVDVEEQRPAGVARIGDVQAAAGETPDQERVHRAEEHVAALGARAQARHGVEQVLQLRAGEIRIKHEPGALAEQLLEALRLERLADRRR